MLFESTRGGVSDVNFDEVLLSAMAKDGGLYVPQNLPTLSCEELQALKGKNYKELASELLPHLLGDHIPKHVIQEIVENAYGSFHHNAIAPLKQLDNNLWLMELFHGPTIAFKDFALQFLGHLLDYTLHREDKKAIIIGATSGDTGSAAIEALKDSENIRLYMLHPKGRVSDVQRKQMTTVQADNITNLAINGSFDDCQAMVKALINDKELNESGYVTAVNSINWARIAAQVVYYFYAGLNLGTPETKINFVVPTGNFGNVYAGHIARSMGLPINKLIIGSNRNDILTRFFETGKMEARNVKLSLTPSMDIQISSNFERLLFELFDRDGEQVKRLMNDFKRNGLYEVSEEILTKAKSLFDAYRVSDERTVEVIQEIFDQTGEILDPHTAIGVEAVITNKKTSSTPTIVLGTAHPSKFPETVKKAIGCPPVLPIYLDHIVAGEEKAIEMENDIEILHKFITEDQGYRQLRTNKTTPI
ncbi:threonine synthase [Curvivirga aplysinae]|uniref:threonine synthase n=1 Tax=Curvivirga aplysinae TaxID=2529852 RepID=UPI0012BC81F3|nr:threonine synthase [Curvivirga aplysinae]MTI11002.1 threonine synthase [Curvivirga aplysinae]